MMTNHKKNISSLRAFTLIEVLIVTSLLALITGFSVYFYFKLSQKDFSLDESADMVVSILNLAKQKSMATEENSNWGVWLKNNPSGNDYLYLFKNTTSTIQENYQLPSGISFFDLNDQNNQIILFQKLTGETNSTTIKIGFSNGSEFRYIKIPSWGAIIIDTQP